MTEEKLLYCFIYKIKENQMYRQEDKARFSNELYIWHDEEYDETIYVQDYKIDIPKVAKNGKDDSPFIYMYSLDKNIHRAMELISKSLKECLDEANEKVKQIQNIFDMFEEKREYIKNKYP